MVRSRTAAASNFPSPPPQSPNAPQDGAEQIVVDETGAATADIAAGAAAAAAGVNFAPEFSQPGYKFHISVDAKPGQKIGDLIQATDPNTADTLTYSLVKDHPFFKIETDGRYGKLLLKGENDGVSSDNKISAGTYKFDIKVTDGRGGEAIATVVVEVEERNNPFLGDGGANDRLDEYEKIKRWANGDLKRREISDSTLALISNEFEIMKQFFGLLGTVTITPPGPKHRPYEVNAAQRLLEKIQAWGWRIEFTPEALPAPYYEINKVQRLIRVASEEIETKAAGYFWGAQQTRVIIPIEAARFLLNALEKVVELPYGKPQFLKKSLSPGDIQNHFGAPVYVAWEQSRELDKKLFNEVRTGVAIHAATLPAGVAIGALADIGGKVVRIAYARSRAVRRAWKQEKHLVKNGLEGTVKWTKKERAELLRRGKVKGYQGHHVNSVKQSLKSNRSHLIGEPDNIQFLKRQDHFDAHGGNWWNETTGKLLDRSKRYKQAGGT